MASNAPERVPWSDHDASFHNSTLAQSRPPVAESGLGRHTPNSKLEAQENWRKGKTISGLSPLVFWLLVLATGLIVIGVSVGGAIGGARNSGKGAAAATADQSASAIPSQSATPTSSSASDTGSTSITSSARSAATSKPITDCPRSNGTVYTPNGTAGGESVWSFQKLCGYNMKDAGRDVTLGSAFVPTFDDCLAYCSNINYWNNGPICLSVAFLETGAPPSNCWASNRTEFQIESGIIQAGLLISV